MKMLESDMKKIDKISNIRSDMPDDIFITCASFEERCLGTLLIFDNYLTNRIVLFKFDEPNPIREKYLLKMEKIFIESGFGEKYKKINVMHGMTEDGILKFHNYCKSENLLTISNDLTITLDISTFTKQLLFDVLFYLTNYLKFKQLRLLYTIPKKYALPDEGPLSYGIKNIKIIPFFWGKWTTIKDDVLVVILGFEEMRAWSLISQFDASINMLIETKPGSKNDWDMLCESYNKRLLNENLKVAEMPAINPCATMETLEEQIIKSKLYENYNIFIAPLGTKPQIVGTFCFIAKHPEANVNIVSTTAIEHNIPYYSSEIGETYCTFIEN